ncbi:hypothetical protein [Pseudomonas sp. SDO558_S425]
MNEDDNLGAWSPTEITETLQRELSAAPLMGADANPTDNFYANTVHALRKYVEITNEESPAIFFLEPEPPVCLTSTQTFTQGRMLHSGQFQLGSRIWFVNSKVQRGKFIELGPLSLADTINELADMGLGDVPAIVFNPTDTENAICLYSNGLDDDFTSSVALKPLTISTLEINKVITSIYDASLKTPILAKLSKVRLWKDSSKWHPEDNVEQEIQGRLQTHFSSNFSQNILPLSEIEAGTGRLDLLLISPGPVPGLIINHALIELKALRTYSNTGTTQYAKSVQFEWIEKGVRQAITYQKSHNPKHTILCCFDMCKNEETDAYWFNPTQNIAGASNVHQWRWRLYNSAEAYRKATEG